MYSITIKCSAHWFPTLVASTYRVLNAGLLRMEEILAFKIGVMVEGLIFEGHKNTNCMC